MEGSTQGETETMRGEIEMNIETNIPAWEGQIGDKQGGPDEGQMGDRGADRGRDGGKEARSDANRRRGPDGRLVRRGQRGWGQM